MVSPNLTKLAGNSCRRRNSLRPAHLLDWASSEWASSAIVRTNRDCLQHPSVPLRSVDRTSAIGDCWHHPRPAAGNPLRGIKENNPATHGHLLRSPTSSTAQRSLARRLHTFATPAPHEASRRSGDDQRRHALQMAGPSAALREPHVSRAQGDLVGRSRKLRGRADSVRAVCTRHRTAASLSRLHPTQLCTLIP